MTHTCFLVTFIISILLFLIKMNNLLKIFLCRICQIETKHKFTQLFLVFSLAKSWRNAPQCFSGQNRDNSCLLSVMKESRGVEPVIFFLLTLLMLLVPTSLSPFPRLISGGKGQAERIKMGSHQLKWHLEWPQVLVCSQNAYGSLLLTLHLAFALIY